MKTKKIWLGMLVMALVFGMMVIGCDNDTTGGGGGETPGGNQPSENQPGGNNPGGTTRSITITGIPAIFDGDLALIALADNSYDIVAAAFGDISGSSITFVLMNSTMTANWTGSGSFILYFEINGWKDYFNGFYTGGRDWTALGLNDNSTEAQFLAALPMRNISTATQTIPFNQFREPLWLWE